MFVGDWDPTNWKHPKSPDKTLEEQFTINALSYMKLATRFLPELQKSSGRIGVVSSAAGVVTIPRLTPYGACKAALHSFFNSVRMELVARKMNTSITINVLGPIATQNALKNVNIYGGLTQEDFYPVEDCAINIVQGITQRERLTYYPQHIKILQFIHFLFPDFIERRLFERYY